MSSEIVPRHWGHCAQNNGPVSTVTMPGREGALGAGVGVRPGTWAARRRALARAPRRAGAWRGTPLGQESVALAVTFNDRGSVLPAAGVFSGPRWLVPDGRTACSERPHEGILRCSTRFSS